MQNRFHNAVDIREYIVIPKPNNTKSKSFEFGRPVGVFDKHFGMLPAVKFNNQFRFKGSKVGNIPADRHLPPKFVTVESAPTQMFPKKLFSFGFVSAKLARTLNTQRRTPSPYPLPRGERV